MATPAWCLIHVYIYVCWNSKDCAFITVWVNDILLFTTTDPIMVHMKDVLQAAWMIMDMGKLRKIVGIEITHDKGTISILQKKYIESILHNKGMENTNHVRMPMNSKVKLEPNPIKMNPTVVIHMHNYWENSNS